MRWLRMSALNCWLFVMPTGQSIDPLLSLSSIDFWSARARAHFLCFQFIFCRTLSRTHTHTPMCGMRGGHFNCAMGHIDSSNLYHIIYVRPFMWLTCSKHQFWKTQTCPIKLTILSSLSLSLSLCHLFISTAINTFECWYFDASCPISWLTPVA